MKTKNIKIVVVGIGNTGVQVVNNITMKNSPNKDAVSTLAIDTNTETLENSLADKNIKINYVKNNYLDGKSTLELVKYCKKND